MPNFCLSRIEACHYRTNETLLELPIYIDVYRNSRQEEDAVKTQIHRKKILSALTRYAVSLNFTNDVQRFDKICNMATSYKCVL